MVRESYDINYVEVLKCQVLHLRGLQRRIATFVFVTARKPRRAAIVSGRENIIVSK